MPLGLRLLSVITLFGCALLVLTLFVGRHFLRRRVGALLRDMSLVMTVVKDFSLCRERLLLLMVMFPTFVVMVLPSLVLIVLVMMVRFNLRYLFIFMMIVVMTASSLMGRGWDTLVIQTLIIKMIMVVLIMMLSSVMDMLLVLLFDMSVTHTLHPVREP